MLVGMASILQVSCSCQSVGHTWSRGLREFGKTCSCTEARLIAEPHSPRLCFMRCRMPCLRSSLEHHALPVHAEHLSPSASGTSDTPRCPLRHRYLVWEKRLFGARGFSLQEHRKLQHTAPSTAREWNEVYNEEVVIFRSKRGASVGAHCGSSNGVINLHLTLKGGVDGYACSFLPSPR